MLAQSTISRHAGGILAMQTRTIKTINSKIPTTIQNTPLLCPPTTPQTINNTYRIPRRASGDLPIYTDYKDGHTRKLTLIRKVEGILEDLVHDLGVFIPQNRITIKNATIVVDGDYSRPVRQWMWFHKF